jgi:hypothetical protein
MPETGAAVFPATAGVPSWPWGSDVSVYAGDFVSRQQGVNYMVPPAANLLTLFVRNAACKITQK